MSKKPVLIDLEGVEDSPNPAAAAPVPDLSFPEAPEGRAMQTVALLAARKPSWLARLFWGSLGLLIATLVSVAMWSFIADLISAYPVLGYGITGLCAIFALSCLIIALREMAAFSRLARLDRMHREADAALLSDDLQAARKVVKDLGALYAGRDDTRWGRERLRDYAEEQMDASGVLGLAEQELLRPLDIAAAKEVEAAARQVATVTAVVPLAFADVIAALTCNLRMIRRVAEVYGGRSGTLGTWRLARAVMTHLVATGAVAVGDDLIGSIAGGGLLSKLSRRFGEGIVNGALTARVGVAAMEVCRPLPFRTEKRPSVTRLVQRALTGLFAKG